MASESPLSDIKMTPDEASKIMDAFKDPEFRKLFEEYAQEISGILENILKFLM